MSKNKLRWLIAGAGLLALAALGLSRISFNIDILGMLPARFPQVEGLSLFLKHFANSREMIVTVETDDADAAARAADSLTEAFNACPSLVKTAVTHPPWEKNPAQLSELAAYLLLNQPPEKIRELAKRLSPENARATVDDTLEKLGESLSPQEIALLSHDPYNLTATLNGETGFASPTLPQSEFSSADGKFRVIYVQSAQPLKNYMAAIRWLRAIREFAAKWNKDWHVTLGFTGEPAFVAETSASMQWDMMSSGFVTLLLIATIFWLCYRRFRPLAVLLGMLLLVFVLSLGAAGLFFKQLTVIGAGYASVMIGLSVDYGYFVYQRSRDHGGSPWDLQKSCLQNILWTSTTTAAAFFSLNLSSLPGLFQLGNLVGIGVIIGAAVMLGIFAPLALRFRRREEVPPPPLVHRLFCSERFVRWGAGCTLLLVAVLLGALVFKGFPKTDFSVRTLRLRHSEADRAYDRLAERLAQGPDTLSLVVRGSDAQQVLDRLRKVEVKLRDEKAHGEVKGYTSALALWPDGKAQKENLSVLHDLAAQSPRLRQTMQDAGFQDNAFTLTQSVLEQWKAWSPSSEAIWPQNETSQWIFRRLTSHAPGECLALGFVQTAPGRSEVVAAALHGEGVYPASWELLGEELKQTIPREIFHIGIALFAAIVVILAFGLRSFRAILLFILTTALVIGCLAGAMALFGMTWGFFNLAAVLLLLGTGTDYSILLLLSLRRSNGDVARAYHDLALVIILCCSSAAAGFGTISWANNAGLSALGKTCALGLVIDALISLFLLPQAWKLLHGGARKG